MAKVSFSKLNLNKNTEVSTFEWGDQVIEVKDYLPIGDKLNLISEIINDSIDKNGYYNPARVYLNTILKEILGGMVLDKTLLAQKIAEAFSSTNDLTDPINRNIEAVAEELINSFNLNKN